MEPEQKPQDQPPAVNPVDTTPQVPNDGQQPTTPSVLPAQQTPLATLQTPQAQPIAGSTAGKRKKMLPVFIAAAVIALLGIGGGVYAALIVPNKPENLFKSALGNTSKAYDAIVEGTKNQEEMKGGVIDGSYKVKVDDTIADGTFKSSFYEKSVIANATLGAGGARFNLDAVAVPVDQSTYPDIYLKVSGLKGLEALAGEGALTGLESLENKWYAIDHTLFDQMSEQGGTNTDLTKADIIAIEEAFGRVNKEYLFTTEPDKAVLKINQVVGKEKRDDRSVVHYVVGYDKEHLKAYVTALHAEMKKTKLGEIYKETYDQNFDLDGKLKAIDADKDSTADVWVDTKTRLIRTVKFTDKDNDKNTIEISLNYNGGDDLPFVIILKDNENGSESTATLRLTLNSKTSNADLSLDFDVKDGESSSYNGNVKATFKPSNDKVDAKKPDGATSILEVLGPIFGGVAPSAEQSAQSEACSAAYEDIANNNGRGEVPEYCQ